MMTKIYRVTTLAALMALLLAAGCTKERPTLEEPADPSASSVTPSYGTTYMSLSLRTGGGSSESEDQDYNYQGDWAGNDDITSFAVYVVSEDRDEVHCIASDKIVVQDAVWGYDDNYEWELKDPAKLAPDVQKWEKGVLTLKPWQTSPGKKTIYAFLNPPAQYVEYLKPTLSNKALFEKAIKKPIPYQGEPGMTYTDAPKLGGFRPDPNIAKKVIYMDLNEYTKEPETKSLTGFSTDNIKAFDNRAFDFVEQPEKSNCEFVKYADHIMCSGIKKDCAVADNVSKSEVSDRRENLAVVSVRRVLAQAVVTWDESIIGHGIKGDPEKEKMELRGIYYQVLNFVPTFYPIAERSNSKWFNIKNTESPSYGQLAPSGLIDFTTYHPYGEENFDPVTLEDERFFRNSIPWKRGSENSPGTDDEIQNLLRQRVLLGPGKVEDGKQYRTTFKFPYETPSVRWGGCYLTETTHPWGEGEDSGYRKGNTPFFAVIASFAIRSLPWDDSALVERKKREEALQKEIADKNAAAEQARREIETLKQQLAQEKADLEKFEVPLKDPNKWGKATEYAQLLVDRDAKQKEYDEAIRQNKSGRARSVKKQLDAIKVKIDNLRKEYYGANTAGYDKHIAAEKKVTDTEDKIAEKYKTINNINSDIKKLTEAAQAIVVDGVKYDDGDDITPITYAHGINRIYYSLVTQKFYLNYHDIPVAKRGGGHNLNLDNNKWLAPLIAERDKAISNDARVKDLLPKPTEPLLKTLSDVLNDDMKAEDLSADEKRAMDFYLYGRVAPDLVPAFKPGARKYDYFDLRLGYVEEYTAKHKDKVVNYEILTRYRGTDTASRTQFNENQMLQTRLLMVYYAWVNPNTNDNRTWYSSPVLRNNIYHMHITGFSKMGLSGIPFVKKPTDPRFTYLHNNDPDEKVPSNDEYLPIKREEPYMGIQVNNVGWGIHSFKKQF